MSKPNISIPARFAINGTKTDFSQTKITDGFDSVGPDILAGDNLNKLIDDTYQGLNGVLELYDAKVSKSGDTMTGALLLDGANFQKKDTFPTSTPSSDTHMHGLEIFGNDTKVGIVAIGYLKNGDIITRMVTQRNVGGITKYSSINVGISASGNAYCAFPNTICCDGQWVTKTLTITTVANSTSVDTYSLWDYLPKDNYCYEVMFCFYFYDTGDKCGSCYIESDVFLPNNATNNADASQEALSNLDRPFGFTQANQNNRSISQVLAVPVGTGRYIKVKCTDANTQRRIYAAGYRRLGTNA